MFKQLLIYKLAPGWQADFHLMEAALAGLPFTECGSTQAVSMGWVAPSGQAHGAVLEVVDGHFQATLQIEKKLLPGAVVRRRQEELSKRIEAESGRKPGKKQQRELKDQATLELLPRAFTRRGQVRVWLDPVRGRLLMDAGSTTLASEVITQLVAAFNSENGLGGFNVLPLHTETSAAVLMRDWLATGEPPAVFTIDQDCELKSTDDSKAVVRYARHPLDIDEVKLHLEAGKAPTRLAVTWRSRVSFTLTEALALRKINFADLVFEGRPERSDDGAENFDADAAIATGELGGLIDDLIECLGGESQGLQQGAGTAAAASKPAAAPAADRAPIPATGGAVDVAPWD